MQHSTLSETQPQQNQRPAPPLSYDRLRGRRIAVVSPDGERMQALVGPYHGAENGFEVRLNMRGGYQDGFSVHLQRQGWQIPQLQPPANHRASELRRLAGRTQTESARRLVAELLT